MTMKHIVIYFILFLFSGLYVNGQPPPDTVYSGWSGIRAHITNAPIIRAGAVAAVLTPVGQRLCFDSRIDVEQLYGGQRVEQSLFLNTTDGYVGFALPGENGTAARDAISPELPDFSLMVFGYQGNVYRYFNRKNKQSVIEHWVSTANTDVHKYQMTDPLTTAPISRKNVTKTFCNGMAVAMAYKLPDLSTVWYVYGDRYPEVLHVQKFFGGFGVGVIRCDEGTFILMEMQAGNNRTTILEIKQSLTCFNPAGFKMEEAEFITKRRRELDIERDKIERQAMQAARATTCQSQRMAIVNFNRSELQKQEQNLNNITHGNTYQDLATQKAYVSMMDPLTTVEVGILDAELSMCNAQEILNHGPSASATQKLSCATITRSNMVALKAQMIAVDTQYATQPGMAMSKKSQLLLQALRNNCQ